MDLKYECILDLFFFPSFFLFCAHPSLFRSNTRQLLVIPEVLRGDFTKANHDVLLSGHLGFNRTYTKMREKYWWPGMYCTVKRWINSCPDCQRNKNPKKQPYGLLQSISVSRPFEKVSADLIGPLPVSKSGKKWIINFTDYLTRYAISASLPDATAETIAPIFIKKIVCRFGAPEAFLTDQGTNFTSNLVSEICQYLSIFKEFTTPYHPQ